MDSTLGFTSRLEKTLPNHCAHLMPSVCQWLPNHSKHQPQPLIESRKRLASPRPRLECPCDGSDLQLFVLRHTAESATQPTCLEQFAAVLPTHFLQPYARCSCLAAGNRAIAKFQLAESSRKAALSDGRAEHSRQSSVMLFGEFSQSQAEGFTINPTHFNSLHLTIKIRIHNANSNRWEISHCAHPC